MKRYYYLTKNKMKNITMNDVKDTLLEYWSNSSEKMEEIVGTSRNVSDK